MHGPLSSAQTAERKARGCVRVHSVAMSFRLLLACAPALLLPALVDAQPALTRASLGPGGVQGNQPSSQAAISSDGRWVAFVSTASNLVVDDTNGTPDIFVRDRWTATTTRVSVGPGGAQATGSALGSDSPAISANGRWVAFQSWSTNLVVGDTNDLLDVFVHDLQTGTTTRVSVGPGGVQGNASCWDPSISADGRFVAFESIREQPGARRDGQHLRHLRPRPANGDHHPRECRPLGRPVKWAQP